MNTHLVIGASGAIGAALLSRLRTLEPSSRILATSRSGQTAADADETFQLDFENPQSISDLAENLETHAPVDTILVATGLLHEGDKRPERALKDIDPDWMAKNFAVNCIGPAQCLAAFLPLQPRDRISRFGVLSARVGSISDNRLGGWHSYRASKAALNMLIRGAAIEQRRRNAQSIIVGLHPGTVDSPLSEPFQRSAKRLFSPQQSANMMLDSLFDLTPDHSGHVIAYDGTIIPA